VKRWLKILLVLGVIGGGVYWMFFREERWPITNEVGRGSAIVAFGDSITAGIGAPKGESYPEQLARLINATVINAGVPGDNSASANRRVERDVLPLSPRIVIVAIGGNDVLQRISVSETMKNVRSIIKTVQRAGAMVVLVGVEPPLSQVNYGKEFKALARETGCAYVPNILKGWFLRPQHMADQIHPNASGAAIIASRVGPVLKRHLETGG
jgi:acyl-CoA thioesterase-1